MTLAAILQDALSARPYSRTRLASRQSGPDWPTPGARARGRVLALRRVRPRAGMAMWAWLSCFLIGHDYSVHCEDGAVFLRCLNCGRRSQGWSLEGVRSRRG